MVLTPEDIDAIANAVVIKLVSNDGLRRVVQEEIEKIATSVLPCQATPPIVTDFQRAKQDSLAAREKSRLKREQREATAINRT